MCRKSFQRDGRKEQASSEMRCLNRVSNGEVNIRRSPIPQQRAFPISQLLKQWGEGAQSCFKYMWSMLLTICRFPLRLMPQTLSHSEECLCHFIAYYHVANYDTFLLSLMSVIMLGFYIRYALIACTL